MQTLTYVNKEWKDITVAADTITETVEGFVVVKRGIHLGSYTTSFIQNYEINHAYPITGAPEHILKRTYSFS